jgi:hypothetical protein
VLRFPTPTPSTPGAAGLAEHATPRPRPRAPRPRASEQTKGPQRYVLRCARGRASAVPGAEVGVQRDGVGIGCGVVVLVCARAAD